MVNNDVRDATERRYGLWNRFFILLALATLFTGTCSYFFSSTLPLHIDSMGGTESLIGVLGTTFVASGVLTRLLAGRLVDRMGRRKMIMAGVAVYAITSFGLGFTGGMPMIFVLRCLQGIGFALTSTAFSVAVVDVIPADRLGEGIGYYGLGNSVSQALGPALSLSLYYSAGGFTAVSTVAGFIILAAALLAGLARYEKVPQFARKPAEESSNEQEAAAATDDGGGKTQSFVWKYIEKTALTAGCIGFFMSFGGGVIGNYVILFADKSGIPNSGLYFTIAAVAIVVSRLLSGRVTDKYGPKFTMIPGFIFGIGAFLFLLMAGSSQTAFYLSGMMYGMFNGTLNPAVNAAAMMAAPPDRRGAATTTYFIPVDLGFMLSSLLGGIAIQYVGYSFAFICACAVFCVGILLTMVFFGKKHVKRRAD